MRRWFKIIGSLILVVLSYIRGLVDVIGEAQTVNDLPILKWIVHPYFSLAAFAGASILGAWAYYDIRVKKGHSGFIGAPGNRRRYEKQAIVAAMGMLALFIAGPFLYGHFKHNYRVNGPSPASTSPTPSAVTSAPNPYVTSPRHPSRLKSKLQTLRKAPSSQQVTIDAPVTQQSSGVCSPNQIGNNNVNNCGPPPLLLRVTWEPSSDPLSNCAGITTNVRITPNLPVSVPMDLTFDVDTPVIVAPDVTVENAGGTSSGGRRWGLHPMVTLLTGITPTNAAVFRVCTAGSIFRAGNAHIEGR